VDLHDRPVFQTFTAAEYKIDISCLPACSQTKVIAIFIFNVQYVSLPFKSVSYLLLPFLFAFAVGNICNVKAVVNTRLQGNEHWAQCIKQKHKVDLIN